VSIVLDRPALSWQRSKKATLKSGTCRRSWVSQCRRYLLEEHRSTNRGRIYYVAKTWVSRQGDFGDWQEIAVARGRGVAIQQCAEHRRQT
jgi:hypothetical protein